MEGIQTCHQTVKESEQKELGSAHTSEGERFLVLPWVFETPSTLQKGAFILHYINYQKE